MFSLFPLPVQLERACVRPSPDNPIVPLILERVAQRSGEEEWKRSSLVCTDVVDLSSVL